MDKRKERSSRQRLRVDTSQEGGEEDGTLLLANPMAGGEVSPQSAVDHTQPKASLSRKIRPKSPSLLRFFVRGTRKASEDIEEATDWTGSDHDDLSVSQHLYTSVFASYVLYSLCLQRENVVITKFF